MANVTINTGATVSISATLPATTGGNPPTSTQWGAVGSANWKSVGEVVDVGEVAVAWTAINHQSVTRDYPQKIEDTFDVGNVTLTLGKVSADVGQIAIQTALASANSQAFKVTLPNGDIEYFTGKVLKAGLGAIASGSVSTTVVDIAIDAETLLEV